eukprot:2289911-Prymnesium_polylepis.1
MSKDSFGPLAGFCLSAGAPAPSPSSSVDRFLNVFFLACMAAAARAVSGSVRGRLKATTWLPDTHKRAPPAAHPGRAAA